MNYTHELWDNSVSQYSFASIGFYNQPSSYSQNQLDLQNQRIDKQQPHILNQKQSTQENQRKIIHSRKNNQSIQSFDVQKKLNIGQNSKEKKKFKPSPYHNYQKHLNTALKHLIVLPIGKEDVPNEISIAQKLWNIFQQNQSSTKKILHFIFNEFNEYRIQQKQLQNYGLKQIYSQANKQILRLAKNYLANIALDQLNEDNIDNYLQTRRIKNPQKFKRYLMIFRRQLEDGFLKKRFTNRNRKQQIRKLLNKNQ